MPYHLFVKTTLLLFGALVACGGHHSTGGDDTDGNVSFTSVRVDPASAVLVVPLGGTATQDYKVLGMTDHGEVDVTAQCGLTVDNTYASIVPSGTLTALPHGGVVPVNASCGGSSASSQLTINITGTIVLGTAPADSATIFGGATLGTDAGKSPAIEYPIDKSVAPLNLPPMELQWKQAGNDLFHVALTSTHATVDVYTVDPQATLDLINWTAIVNTAVGESLAMTVEGLVQASPTTKYASTGITLGLSHDTIDTSAIYYWASSQGSIMSTVFGKTDPPKVVKDNCTACHSLSRSGSRIGYSRCFDNCRQEFVGFMHYNTTTMAWDEVVNADANKIPGTYTTFAPKGNPFPDDTQGLAMVTSPTGTLGLFDPDTGDAVASNLAAVAQPGHSALMPDWSADGKSVVFASTPHITQSVDVLDSSIATMSYEYANATHTFGTPTPLVTAPITLNGASYTNLFFPSYSPDGALVVFNAARASWRNFNDAKTAGQRLVLVPAGGGTPIDLTALNSGTGDHDITWPHWAPGATADYYWIVFASELDYGHELTASNTATPCVANGVKQCKQIWIGAISKAALMNGTADPSFAPVWLPGQDVKADNISPYWTVPAGLLQ